MQQFFRFRQTKLPQIFAEINAEILFQQVTHISNTHLIVIGQHRNREVRIAERRFDQFLKLSGRNRFFGLFVNIQQRQRIPADVFSLFAIGKTAVEVKRFVVQITICSIF